MNLNERNASPGCIYDTDRGFVVSFMKKNGYNVTIQSHANWGRVCLFTSILAQIYMAK